MNNTASSPVDYPTKKRIGILVFDNFEPLDVWGFCQAFAISRFIGTNYQETQHLPFELILIANEDSGDSQSTEPAPIKSYNGPRVAPDLFRDQALEQQFDVIMVPGGQGVREIFKDENQLPQTKQWITAINDNTQLMTSVCTGAALLAATGLLDNQAAATNHQGFAWVSEQGPNVLWDNVARWVDAGHFVTSAGVSAGTDMAFYLVQKLAGRAVAEQAALASEYDWHRDPNTPTFYPQQATVA